MEVAQQVFLGSANRRGSLNGMHFRNSLHKQHHGLPGSDVMTNYSVTDIFVYLLLSRPSSEVYKWDKKFFFPSHLRLGPWVIGIMLGYILHKTRGTKIKISKTLNAVLWVSAIGMFFFLNFSYYYFIQLKDTLKMFLHAISASFYRVLWSLMVSAIIFGCQNGSGGIIRWFLSLKDWQLLGRMGLSIYLVHRVYQIITTFNQKQPIHWDFFTQSQKTFGDILVSIFFGVILYLSVETPVMLIENYLYKTFKKQQK